MCVGRAGAVASFTATAFELCKCGLVDEMDELPAPGSHSSRQFLVVIQPVQRAEMWGVVLALKAVSPFLSASKIICGACSWTRACRKSHLNSHCLWWWLGLVQLRTARHCTAGRSKVILRIFVFHQGQVLSADKMSYGLAAAAADLAVASRWILICSLTMSLRCS